LSRTSSPRFFSPSEASGLIVEFARPLRGFCLGVGELNNALLWVTIEGPREKISAQIWLSAFDVDEDRLNAVEKNGRGAGPKFSAKRRNHGLSGSAF
jgi:hypothetical protein